MAVCIAGGYGLSDCRRMNLVEMTTVLRQRRKKLPVLRVYKEIIIFEKTPTGLASSKPVSAIATLFMSL